MKMRACIAFASLLLCMALPARATLISGSFTGTAVNVYGSPFDVREGDPVTGVFSFDTAYPYIPGLGDGSTFATFTYGSTPSPDPLPPPPLYIAIQAPANTYALAGAIVDIEMYQGPAGQRLVLKTGYMSGACCAALLDLSGGPGAFFSALDPAYIEPVSIDLARSFASFAYKGTLDFDVALSSIALDATVPEPGSLTMAAAAFGLLALTTRRRRQP